MNGPIDPVQLSTANVETSNNFSHITFDNIEEGKYYYTYIDTLGPELFLVEVYEKGDNNLTLNIHFSKNEDNVWEEPPYNYSERTQTFEADDIYNNIKLYKPKQNNGGVRKKRSSKKRLTKRKIVKRRKTFKKCN